MSDSSVPLSDVLIVLKAKGVSISALDKTRNTYLLVGNGWLEVSTFTERVGKKDLRYLGRKFRIDLHLFWHPEMLLYSPGDNPN